MKKLLFLITIFIIETAGAVELSTEIFTEVGGMDYRTDTALNQDNYLLLNGFRNYNRVLLSLKTAFGDSDTAKGFVQLQGLYIPVDFYAKDTTGNTSEEKISLKAVYFQFMNNYLTFRTGKQFIRWGSGIFFNPLDIVNKPRDLLRPIDEAQGRPFAHLIIPIMNLFSFELLTLYENNDDEEISGIDWVPLIAKLSFSYNAFSWYGFVKVQQEENPLPGINFDYVGNIGEYTDFKIFSEALFRFSSNQSVIQINQLIPELVERSDDFYPAILIGGNINYSSPESHIFNTISFNLEYYYDRENWNHHEYMDFYNTLSTLIASGFDLTQFSQDQSPVKQFKNARHYLAGGITFQSLFIEDLTWHTTVILNAEDLSLVVYPDIFYTFSNQNARCGIKAYYFDGKETSEFGSFPARLQAFFYGSFIY